MAEKLNISEDEALKLMYEMEKSKTIKRVVTNIAGEVFVRNIKAKHFRNMNT